MKRMPFCCRHDLCDLCKPSEGGAIQNPIAVALVLGSLVRSVPGMKAQRAIYLKRHLVSKSMTVDTASEPRDNEDRRTPPDVSFLRALPKGATHVGSDPLVTFFTGL